MDIVTEQKIALIEDDPLVRHTTQQWLDLAGFDVQSFETAETALGSITDNSFCAIVSDVRLPGQSGLDLMQQVKAVNPSIPIVLITGHGDVDMAVKALQKGAFDFIEKPFEPERLSDTISQAIAHYQSSKHWQSRQHYRGEGKAGKENKKAGGYTSRPSCPARGVPGQD